jgi:S-DNA-T family DNA segregation ATPase FtsK/SpoIIIE
MTTTEHETGQATPEPEPRPIQPDLDAPILPMWARDKDTFTSTSRQLRKRTGYRVRKFLLHLPAVAFWLLGIYPWRGLARIVAKLSRYLYDYDSAMVRHEHAGRVETAEYVRAQNVRKANLKARWMVAGTVTLVVVGPPLAWTFPSVLSGICGVALAVWIIKLIPGRSMWEIVVAAAAGIAVGVFGPDALALIPRPPGWAVTAVLGGGWLGLGFLGRPEGKSLVKGTTMGEGIVMPLKAPMVREALCQLGISGMKEPDQIRLLQDAHRYGPGVQMDLDLPVAATQVMKKREELAAKLKRELGCVWPSVGTRHAAHLALYVCDEPVVRQRQRDWPLAKGGRVDIFQPVPFVTDRRGEWVDVTFVPSSVVIGALPRMGKTWLLRQALLAAGLDPRTRVYALDGKGTGDLAPCRLFAHFHSSGEDPEEVEERVLPMLRGLQDERRRRARFIRDLPREEAPESKVTSELVDRYPHLAPIVLGVDESQTYFGYGMPKNRAHKAVRDEIIALVTDLVKLGPALGFVTILATQNVCEETIPRQIGTNAAIRFALKLFDHVTNDQVMGTGAYSKGVDATVFDIDDKGIAVMRADGSQPQVVRSVAGLDAIRSERIAERARALRLSLGRLTGEAADQVMDDEARQVVLLDDVREVFGQVDAMHLSDLVAGLAEVRPELYGHLDVFSLGKLLRSAGVKVDNVHVAGKPREESSRKGVKREWLDVSATETIGEPDDEAEEG